MCVLGDRHLVSLGMLPITFFGEEKRVELSARDCRDPERSRFMAVPSEAIDLRGDLFLLPLNFSSMLSSTFLRLIRSTSNGVNFSMNALMVM